MTVVTEITDYVVGIRNGLLPRRQTVRWFLAHIWLETDDDGWTICTVRDIRSSYASLLGQCEISYQGSALCPR